MQDMYIHMYMYIYIYVYTIEREIYRYVAGGYEDVDRLAEANCHDLLGERLGWFCN